MKRFSFGAVVVAVLLAAALMAWAGWERQSKDVEYTGKNEFAPQSTINMRGTIQIGGTNVTAGAAELNAAGAGSAATITPSLITNVTGVMVFSNSTLKGSQTVAGKTTLTGGLDGELHVGADTNQFVVWTNGNTRVGGILTVVGTPVFTGTTPSGAVTIAVNNAPILTNTAPVWVNITIGGEAYVVPAYRLCD
jgi:hypothetical protein